MPRGLKRYQQEGDDHFITFSCYGRQPYLSTPSSKDIFLDSLELTRRRYGFEVLGYVVMPEHVYLLLSEPLEDLLSKAMHSPEALRLQTAYSKTLLAAPLLRLRSNSRT